MTVELNEGEDFLAWAAQAWPRPRYQAVLVPELSTLGGRPPHAGAPIEPMMLRACPAVTPGKLSSRAPPEDYSKLTMRNETS